MSKEPTMTIEGKIIEVFENGLVTFKVKTKLGIAFVWVYEEIEINFKIGSRFHVDDAPITFSDGYTIAIIKPGVTFFLNDTSYQTVDLS